MSLHGGVHVFQRKDHFLKMETKTKLNVTYITVNVRGCNVCSMHTYERLPDECCINLFII